MMFCPNCGVQNLSDQSHCKGCGEFLFPLQFNRLVTVKLKASEKMLRVGSTVLTLFALSGLLIIFLGLVVRLTAGESAVPNGYVLIVLATLSLGTVLGTPFILFGKMRLSRALHEAEESHSAAALSETRLYARAVSAFRAARRSARRS